MSWVAWRQFRLQALAGAVVLGALAVLMLVTGLHLRDLYDASGLSHCSGGACGGEKAQPLTTTYAPLRQLLGVGVILAPVLVGVFWGAPLVSRELESGTFRLAWAQSVTRTRWLAVKLAIVGCSGIVLCELYSLMFTWWAHPIDQVQLNRFGPGVFDERGIVAIGYAAFAFALGVFAGAVTRRTLLAIAITLLAFLGVRLGAALGLREHLESPSHRSSALSFGNGVGLIGTPSGLIPAATNPQIPNAWVLSTQIVSKDGRPVPERTLLAVFRSQCPTAAQPPNGEGGGATPEAVEGCFVQLSNRYHELITYQPAKRFWVFQGLETAIFSALALLLGWASFWWIGRDAPRREPRRAAWRRPSRLDATGAGTA